MHARNAWLKGISPKENRELPPLRYETVHRLKRARLIDSFAYDFETCRPGVLVYENKFPVFSRLNAHTKIGIGGIRIDEYIT